MLRAGRGRGLVALGTRPTATSGWNSGAVAGQQVFHAHLHVIPGFAQEPLAGLGIRAHLKADANRW